MTSLLIAYHTRTGGSEQMARAAYEAAKPELPDTFLKRADEVMPEDVLSAQGYIFCAPENLASLSGVMKDMFDRCYYPVLGRIEGRPYAQMICAGSDGEGAMRQLARIVTGWRLKEVQPGIILNTDAQSPEAILAPKHLSAEQLAPCADLGAAIGAGLALGVF